jgi:hypothetical protein
VREGGGRKWWTARVACLLVGLAIVIVTDPALACPTDRSDRYDSSVNLGFSIGFSVIRQLSLTYGIDFRLGHGPAVGWFRVEGHGLNYARVAAGLKLFHPGTGAELEAGVASNSAHHNDNTEHAWGAHLALGRWNPNVDAQIQGTIPFAGDLKNYDLGLATFFPVPGNWYYAIGCND